MDNKNCIMTDQYKRIQGAKLRLQNKTVSVYKGVNTVGRNKVATINLKNVNVSQHQAVIIIVDDTQHFISDLNSSNGTYLLDTKLAPFKLYELSNEMQIKFGDVTATYLKMPNLSTTVHLETETMEMTQNVTQNFYAATTQLMFDDTSLNRTRLSSLQHQNTPNRDSQDIHEAATQVAVYPPTITDTEAETSNVVVETINDDIHNAATQVIMDIHDAPTQVIFFPPQASTSKASQNNISEPAEFVVPPKSLPQTNANQNNQEEDVHEMATQVVSIHEMATQVVSFKPEAIDDTQKQIEENHPKIDESTTPITKSGKPNDGILNPIPQVADSFNTVQTHVDLSVIQDSIIEETVIEENENLRNIEVVNENSNDSMDFLTIQQPFEGEITKANDNANVVDDKNSAGSDSEVFGQPKRKMSRKLSSSEDLSELQNVQKPSISDSETDIDDSDNINSSKRKKLQKLSSKSLRQAQTSKICNSDSETDIEEDVLKVNKKQPLCNSDTDIEDEKLNLSQTEDIIKPKILKRKSIFSSDSETDIEDNKKQESVLEAAQDGDSNATEILNDTDYIPATQDAFANMFQYKNAKYSNSNHNSQNVSSEESFKLGLTELMIDGEENNQGINEEVSKDQSKDVNQRCNKPSTFNAGEKEADLSTENICKKDEDIYLMPTQKLKPKIVNDSSKIVSDVLKNTDEDLYMMATQKIVEGKLDAQKLAMNIINEPKGIPSTSKMVASIEKVADEDDMYMMPTQKMEENAKSVKKMNELNNIPSTSKMATNIEKELDEDLYMLATQKINNSEHEFKAPVKKFTFKKKATNLDGSLTTILSSKEEEDPYLMATQQINETETNNEDDVYMQATQKLENNSESNNEKTALYMQPTQDLNLVDPITSEKEENVLMAPTQQIDQDAINKMYDLETQKLDSQSSLETIKLACNDHVGKDDLYDLPAQPLPITLDQDSPKRKRTKKSDIDNLKRTIESSHTDGFVKKPLEKCETEEDKEKVETLSQIEAFVKKPFEVARKQEDSGSKFVKDEGQFNKAKIEAPVKNKKQLDSALPTEKSSSKKDVPISKREDEEISRAETLSQIEAFVKEPLRLAAPRSKKISQIEPSSSSSSTKENDISQIRKENDPLNKNAISKAKTRGPRTRQSTKPIEEDLYMAPTQEIYQDSVTEKAITVSESSKASEDVLYIAVNKEDPNNSLYMLETQKIDSQPDDIPQSEERPPSALVNEGSNETKRSASNLEPSNLNIPKRKKMKKSDIENLKKTIGSEDKVENSVEIDRPETLSQIEAFIKNPSDIDVPKLKKIEEKPSTSRSESKFGLTDTIVGLIKNKSETEEPEKLTRMSRTRQYTKHFEEENNKGRNKASAKPKSTHQINPQKPTEESAETEIKNVSVDKNLSADTIKSDIDQSFALLEAQSTKTRKSSRITNVGEVKVAACKNRRSMTTASIPELSKTGAIEPKPSTRRSRKIIVNNNIVATALQSKIDDRSIQITGKSITAKRKPDTSDSDFSESEVPTKMLKVNNAGRGKRKASIKDDISKIYTLSEESHEDIELPAKTVKASVTRKGKGKETVKDDSDKASNASDESGRDFELPARVLKASKDKGKATGKDESGTTSTSDEGNKGKEPATPTTSRARLKSRTTISKSTDSDKASNASDESGRNFELPARALKASKGKGKATGKNESDTTSSTNDESNRSKEPATPTASRARVNSRRTVSKSTGDDGSDSALGTSVATPRRGRKNVLNDELLDTPERLRRKQRPKVVFTMLDNPQLESLIRQLGGSIVDNVDTSTVLVTEHVKRSQKLLAAVGQGKPICSPSWIRESKKANEFLDPWDFILIDKEAESKWSFSLKESISKAASEKLLINYSFQLLVNNAVDVLKGAIEACGGKCVTRNPPKNAEGFYVVVSSPENRTKYLKIKKQHPEVIVVEPEAIFDGVLRQDLRLGRHLLT